MLDRAVFTAAGPVLTSFAIVGFPVDAMERDEMIFAAVFTCREGVNACLLERVCLYPVSAVLLHSAHFLCFSLFLLICTLNANFLSYFQNSPTARKAVCKEFLMELKD